MRLEVPRWGRLSGYVRLCESIPEQDGRRAVFFFRRRCDLGINGYRPNCDLPDQRNTLAVHACEFKAAKRFWVAASYEYDSGLPVEINTARLIIVFSSSQYGANMLDH